MFHSHRRPQLKRQRCCCARLISPCRGRNSFQRTNTSLHPVLSHKKTLLSCPSQPVSTAPGRDCLPQSGQGLLRGADKAALGIAPAALCALPSRLLMTPRGAARSV